MAWEKNEEIRSRRKKVKRCPSPGEIPKRVSRLRKGIQTPPTTEPLQDPVIGSNFCFPSGIRYPIPFCNPEYFFHGGDLQLFEGHPSLFAETLTQEIHVPHDGNVILPTELLEEWLLFEPETEFQPAVIRPSEFKHLCDDVVSQISALESSPVPSSHVPLFPSLFPFHNHPAKHCDAPQSLREKNTSRSTQGVESAARSSQAPIPRQLGFIEDKDLDDSAASSFSENFIAEETAALSELREVARKGTACFEGLRGVLPLVKPRPRFSNHFQRFLEAGLRVPDVPEAIASCVRRERQDWEKKLSRSMQRSLQKARHNKGKKFNRFACKIAWPPVSQCNPWSERNLWSNYRTTAEKEKCQSFCLAFDYCTTRFDRHYMTHNFAGDQHSVLRKACERALIAENRHRIDPGQLSTSCTESATALDEEHSNEETHENSIHTFLESKAERSEESNQAPVTNHELSELLGAKGVSSSEIILTVSFSHGRKGTKLAEFDVLGSQTLAELRDAFHCEADCEPGVRHCLGSCFLIDGILFPDLRDPRALDYSAMIAEHLRKSHKVAPNKYPVCQHDARLETTRILLQGRCAFLHQGDCEHRVVFSSLRRFNKLLDCPFRDSYPIRTFKPSLRRQMCQACNKQLATSGIANSAFFCTPQNPTFLCQACRECLAEDINDSDAIEFKLFDT